MRFPSLSKPQKPAPVLLNGDADPSGSRKLTQAIYFLTRRVVVLVILGVPALYITHLFLLSFYSRILSSSYYRQYEPIHPDLDKPAKEQAPIHASPPQHAHLLPPPLTTERMNDLSDTFQDYEHAHQCNISSLDLHFPIQPLCDTRRSTLEAMSSGGRAGFDQPFIPLGCDFRWYTTEEICTIISRFSHIYIIGDSLQRMLVAALYIFLRKDIGLGGIGEWNFKPDKNPTNETVNSVADCMCAHQFNKHECSHSPIFRYTRALKESEPHKFPACGVIDAKNGSYPFDISYHELQKYPITAEEVQDIKSAVISKRRPPKPPAFVFHHTFWNDVNTTATVAWLDQLTDVLREALPWLPAPELGPTYYVQGNRGFPRLFVTANAAGALKNSVYLETQNSNAVAKFEADMRPHLDFRNIELLGFYNMSVQTTSSDGTHANIQTNLLKAMMVLNWLDWVGKEENEHWDPKDTSPNAKGGVEE